MHPLEDNDGSEGDTQYGPLFDADSLILMQFLEKNLRNDRLTYSPREWHSWVILEPPLEDVFFYLE